MPKMGIREICDVTFKCKADNTKIGDKTFMKDQLVIHFDTCKTSSLEGTATPVYAQGGRGNPKLITWEGEKAVTFTFEDALISPLGLSILLGAELTSSEDHYHHVLIKGRAVAPTEEDGKPTIDINDEIHDLGGPTAILCDGTGTSEADKVAKFTVYTSDESGSTYGTIVADATSAQNVISATALVAGGYYFIDGYVKVSGTQLNITPDKFSDYFYIEAETLFRRESDGTDRPAQFIIPKGKVASEFNIAMANSGDPSTFTFKVEAMADYIKFNRTKKVLCAINIID